VHWVGNPTKGNGAMNGRINPSPTHIMAIKNVIFQGKQYEVEALPENARKMFGLLKTATEQIARAQAEIAVAEAGRIQLNRELEQVLATVPSTTV
jgi:Family of unknown function (DUF6447)